MKLHTLKRWCGIGWMFFAMVGCMPDDPVGGVCTGPAGQGGAGVSPPAGSNGTTCTVNTECLSGYCIDGVCCNELCSATCKVCNLPSSEGTCTEFAPGACSACAGTLAFSGLPLAPGRGHWMEMGDLNGDGITDMALSKPTDDDPLRGTISVVFGHGDGTFSAASVLAVGVSIHGWSYVNIADLNGDARPDLVDGDTLFLNQGQGTFSNIVRNDLVHIVAAADFNCDGQGDLVSFWADVIPGTFDYYDVIAVSMNSGNATFLPPTKILAEKDPGQALTPDLNGDGYPDLVVSYLQDTNISVLLNQGDGTFSAKTNYDVQFAGATMFAADLTNDGLVDLAMNVGSGQRVIVLINQGQGILANPVEYPISAESTGTIVAADLDGDGWKDLATTTSGPESLSVLLNQGNGTFTAEVKYVVMAGPGAVRAADLDRDGKMDLAIAHGSSETEVLINQGAGTFTSKTEILSGTIYKDVVATDLNGDALPDVAVLHDTLTIHAVEVLINQGNGVFVPGGATSVDSSVWGMAVADLNGDTFPDVVLGTSVMPPNANILINQGNGTFVGGGALTFDAWIGELAAGDIDGNGWVDIATTNGGDNTVGIYLNLGGGVFAPQVKLPTGLHPKAMKMGDLNGDGMLDVAVGNLVDTSISLLFNQGGGTFASRIEYPLDKPPGAIEMADVDGNRGLDLLVINDYESTKLSVLRNRGDGTFEPKVDYDTIATPELYAQATPQALRVGDVNQDGAIDVILVASSMAAIDVFFNRGDGTFIDAVSYGAGIGPSAMAMADIDGNGTPDFVVGHDSIPHYAGAENRPQSGVYLMLNQCIP